MTDDKYQHLRQLLGGYLHQDWNLEFRSPDDAIAAFKQREPQECVQATYRELQEVLPLIEGMHNPDEFLWQTLWCYYYPKADGLTVTAWLERVREMLSQ